MSSIIMAANAVSNGMAVFKPLYWLFGKCMEFLLDVLNNQYFHCSNPFASFAA